MVETRRRLSRKYTVFTNMKDKDFNINSDEEKETKVPTTIDCKKTKVVGGVKYALLNDEPWPANES